MANVVKIFWSKITGHVPAELVDGQIAINQKDKKIFYPDESGTVQEFSLTNKQPTFTTINFGSNPINQKTSQIIQKIIQFMSFCLNFAIYDYLWVFS